MTKILYAVLYINLSRVVEFNVALTFFNFDSLFE